ncbi:MAG: hypothetical protein KatS3mg132_791 [Limisphaera sp.]|nr:MAG: hypothetical protein KatS3mg132_791 [Limisphaera sp.]
MKTEPQVPIAFYLASVLLVVAILGTGIQKKYEAHSASLIAKRADTTSASSAPYLELEGRQFVEVARAAEVASYTTAVLGVLCWSLALRRQERHPVSLLAGLVALYVLLQLLMV